jgi:hypothetical protein
VITGNPELDPKRLIGRQSGLNTSMPLVVFGSAFELFVGT